MGENNCKQCNQQGFNFQNTQTAQLKNKNPHNQKDLNRHFPKEDAQITMKRCSTSQIIYTNQNCNEVSPHSDQNNHHYKVYKQ